MIPVVVVCVWSDPAASTRCRVGSDACIGVVPNPGAKTAAPCIGAAVVVAAEELFRSLSSLVVEEETCCWPPVDVRPPTDGPSSRTGLNVLA